MTNQITVLVLYHKILLLYHIHCNNIIFDTQLVTKYDLKTDNYGYTQETLQQLANLILAPLKYVVSTVGH